MVAVGVTLTLVPLVTVPTRLLMEPVPPVKAKARELHPAAPQMLAGMDAGWSQSLERLAALVGATAK